MGVFDKKKSISPDIFFVGMGSPKQEKWIHNNRDKISAKICGAVGALFNYVSGEEKIVPGWVNNLGLE